jgi:hypothetical protein
MNLYFPGHDYWFLIGFLLILAGYVLDWLLNKAYKKYDDKEDK